MGFFDWLGGLNLFQWYAVILGIELAVGFAEMFVKDRGAEFKEIRASAPSWSPDWLDYTIALLTVVIAAVLWPVFTLIDLYHLGKRVIVWAADKYLNWYTMRTLKKMGLFEDAFAEGGSVYGPTQDDDDTITVMFDADGNIVRPEGKWSGE